MFDNILDRALGPEPENEKFQPLNESKIIPFHDCTYAEAQTWNWHGFRMANLCTTCGQPPPPLPTPPEEV